MEKLEESEQNPMMLFHKFLDTKLKSGEKIDGKKLISEAERLFVRDKAPLVLANVLFDQSIVSQIKIYREPLLHFCHDNTKCQKYLLEGLEHVIDQYQTKLLNKVGSILKGLYNLDIIDKDVMIEWHSNLTEVTKPSMSRKLISEIHKKADPFKKWLKDKDTDVTCECENGN